MKTMTSHVHSSNASNQNEAADPRPGHYYVSAMTSALAIRPQSAKRTDRKTRKEPTAEQKEAAAARRAATRTQ